MPVPPPPPPSPSPPTLEDKTGNSQLQQQHLDNCRYLQQIITSTTTSAATTTGTSTKLRSLFVLLGGEEQAVSILLISQYYSLCSTWDLNLNVVIVLPPASNDSSHIQQILLNECDSFFLPAPASASASDSSHPSSEAFIAASGSTFLTEIEQANKTRQLANREPLRQIPLNADLASKQPKSADSVTQSSDTTTTTTAASSSTVGAAKFSIVAIGGTFDHLHAGHKVLLSQAAILCTTELVIGVSADELLKNKKFKEFLQSIDVRIANVVQFMHFIKPSIKINAVPLHDMYGPTAVYSDIQCLVVSQETQEGGLMLNEERARLGFPPMEFVVVDCVQPPSPEVIQALGLDFSAFSSSNDSKLSSTTLRELEAKEAARIADTHHT